MNTLLSEMKNRAGMPFALYQERRNVFQKIPLVPG